LGLATTSAPVGILYPQFLETQLLTHGRESVSSINIRRKRLIAAREKSLARLPITGELLRGSLLERNHVRNAKCASGEGHRLSVLTVSYPGGRTRQSSLRSEMVPLVRRWLANYQRLKAAIEASARSTRICCVRMWNQKDFSGDFCAGK
jgi:hypothetical protein